MTFKVSNWQSFLQGTLIFILTQNNFLKFGNGRKIMPYLSTLFEWFLAIRMWYFFFLTHFDFASGLNFINWIKFFCSWCGCGKYESCLRKSVYFMCLISQKCLGTRMLTGNMLSRMCCLLIFSSACFFALSVFFSWLGCSC